MHFKRVPLSPTPSSRCLPDSFSASTKEPYANFPIQCFISFMLDTTDHSCLQPRSRTIFLTWNVPFPLSNMLIMLISPSSPCVFYKIQNPPSSHTISLPQRDFSWLEISWAQVDSLNISTLCYYLWIINLLEGRLLNHFFFWGGGTMFTVSTDI